MLSSIHPLGERVRHSSWGRTVAAFTVGAMSAAALLGAALGALGGLLIDAPSGTGLVVLGLAAVLAGGFDLAGVTAPGPHRQVNERWIGAYRDWVYGGAFGLQLGAGSTTYVVTWGVWVTFLAELLSGSASAGAVIGVVFGLGRSLPVLAGRYIDRPSRLVATSERLRRLARPVWRSAATTTALTGALALTLGVV